MAFSSNALRMRSARSHSRDTRPSVPSTQRDRVVASTAAYSPMVRTVRKTATSALVFGHTVGRAVSPQASISRISGRWTWTHTIARSSSSKSSGAPTKGSVGSPESPGGGGGGAGGTSWSSSSKSPASSEAHNARGTSGYLRNAFARSSAASRFDSRADSSTSAIAFSSSAPAKNAAKSAWNRTPFSSLAFQSALATSHSRASVAAESFWRWNRPGTSHSGPRASIARYPRRGPMTSRVRSTAIAALRSVARASKTPETKSESVVVGFAFDSVGSSIVAPVSPSARARPSSLLSRHLASSRSCAVASRRAFGSTRTQLPSLSSAAAASACPSTPLSNARTAALAAAPASAADASAVVCRCGTTPGCRLANRTFTSTPNSAAEISSMSSRRCVCIG